MEEWRAVPGYEEFYSVSSHGQVKSHDRLVPHIKEGRRLKGRLLKQKINKQNGYPCVELMVSRVQKTFPVHVLVALAFIGPRPEGMFIAHYDGSRTNNFIGNLRYATPAENSADAKRHNAIARGKRMPQSKLTEESVLAIRLDRRMQKEIAEEYGVSITTISQVKNFKQWAHVI